MAKWDCLGQFLNSQVPMPDGFAIVVVLQSDVAHRGASFGIDPGSDRFPIYRNSVLLSDASNLVSVPFADGLGVRFARSLKRVDRARPPGGIFWIRITDLDFMPLAHGVPGISLRIWEPHKHSRISNFLLLNKLASQHEIRELSGRVPP